jgi:pyrimidine operon attenuation protein / uracil phosphoribosyltransferase
VAVVHRCKAAIFIKIFELVKTLLSQQQIALTIKRLAHQILENHISLTDTVFIGLQPRGIFVSDRLIHELQQLVSPQQIVYGKLDITFYRDDVRQHLHAANKTDILFSIENKQVILIDDVLWTGRTIRAALDALLDFGRPAKVELCALIDRRFSREFPIQAEYIGRSIDTFATQKVLVRWAEKDGQDEIVLI